MYKRAYKNGLREEKKIICKNGNIFEGQFKEGKLDGKRKPISIII